MKRADKFANVVIFSAILGVGAVVVYLFYKQMQGVPTPLYYYSAVLVALFGLLATLKLSRPHRLNVVIMLISIFVMVYSMEAMLFFYGNPLSYRTPRYLAAQRSGIEYDSRTPLQVVDQLRREGIDAYPYVAPHYFIGAMPAIDDEPIYALGGIANVTTVMCNESGEYIIYESDRYGFPNPDTVWEAPNADIVTVGDSFTQGACVPLEENMVGQIRAAYPQTLNLGSSGSGPLGMLAALTEYGAAYKPPIVLWFYFEGNDLGDMLNERENPFLVNYLEGDFTQDLMARQAEVDETRHQYVTALIDNLQKSRRGELIASLRLYNIRRLLGLTREPPPEKRQISSYEELIVEIGSHKSQAVDKFLAFDTVAQTTDSMSDTIIDQTAEVDPIFEEGIDYFGDVLAASQAYVASWDGELIFVYLPDYMRYDAENAVSEEAMYRLEILPIIDELGVPMIDIHQTFSAHPNPASFFPFEMQGHYNEEGYALVAEEVLKFLENR